MTLKEQVAEIVARHTEDSMYELPSDQIADLILAIPEIRDALEDAAFNRIMQKSGGFGPKTI